MDTPDESAALCRKAGYTYRFFSDPNAEVIRRYDLLHQRGSPDGKDIARPAEFLVDAYCSAKRHCDARSPTSLIIFTAKETTKGKVTSSCFRQRKLASKNPEAEYAVGSASAAY